MLARESRVHSSSNFSESGRRKTAFLVQATLIRRLNRDLSPFEPATTTQRGITTRNVGEDWNKNVSEEKNSASEDLLKLDGRIFFESWRRIRTGYVFFAVQEASTKGDCRLVSLQAM